MKKLIIALVFLSSCTYPVSNADTKIRTEIVEKIVQVDTCIQSYKPAHPKKIKFVSGEQAIEELFLEGWDIQHVYHRPNIDFDVEAIMVKY